VLVTRTGILQRERRVLYYLCREREKEVLDLVAVAWPLDLMHVSRDRSSPATL
jgi:hypothetical protein